jgi:RNA polymerase sigma-70 factor (ECF subfamily)
VEREAELYSAYHTPLFNFLARLSRRREVAEDLVEETFLRLVSRAGRLHEDTRLAPWLFTVARNLYLSYCRSRLLESSHAADLIGSWTGGAPVPSPFEATAASEAHRRLEAALAALPGTYREVLLLVGVQGLTPAEAALVCSISPEALRQRLSRARALLARRLDEATATHLSILREVVP